ncbi:MAG: NUDIX domain-containing protein [Candidatus Pacebacteria bacterium]|nr:NUDIX domain-containing protein [Candidatus Paceibacterota bacterium]
MSNIRPNALVIIRKDNYILAEKGVDNNTGKVFYRLLGGGIEFGELAIDALKREIKEELDATMIHEKFLCISQNIFEFNAKQGHEITFLFEGGLYEQALYKKENIRIIDKENSYAEWIPVDDIKDGNIILYPEEAVSYL